MKKNILMAAIVMSSVTAFSQGWVGNSTSNSLFAVNSSLSLSPIAVGIGINNPTEQLHTTLGVRFQGIAQDNSLSRILAQDANGKLFWRDASTFGTTGNFWRLNGNTTTIPGVGPGQNFLGTTDANRLVIATNSIERMTVLDGNGNVGIGITNPTAALHISSNTPASHVRITGVAPNIQFLDNPTTPTQFSNIGFVTQANNYVVGGVPGDLVLQTFNSSSPQTNIRSIIFATGLVFPGQSNANGIERMRLDGTGKFGVSTQTPTAALHVNCNVVPLTGGAASNVRFENLQTGRGTALVIDANGYVLRSNAIAAAASDITTTDIEAIKKDLKETKAELETLKSQLRSFISMNASNKLSTSENNSLEIAPTPFNEQVRITYSIAEYKAGTALQVVDSKGVLLKSVPLYQKKGQVDISNLTPNGNTLIFSILSGGKTIISKQSIKLQN